LEIFYFLLFYFRSCKESEAISSEKKQRLSSSASSDFNSQGTSVSSTGGDDAGEAVENFKEAQSVDKSEKKEIVVKELGALPGLSAYSSSDSSDSDT